MEEPVHARLLEKVNSYVMPDQARRLVTDSQLMVICGVTAAGKNTIVNYLIEHADFEYIVSHTTRNPRVNHGTLEKNGKDYWFVNETQMLDLVEQGAFVEVKGVHGDFYGTSIMSIMHAVKDKKRPITEIDVQGAVELAQVLPSLRPMFILPPSYDVWMERLGTRGFISDGDKERRLVSARAELQTAINNPAFMLVVNHEVELTAQDIMRGADLSMDKQAELRKLAHELYETIR